MSQHHASAVSHASIHVHDKEATEHSSHTHDDNPFLADSSAHAERDSTHAAPSSPSTAAHSHSHPHGSHHHAGHHHAVPSHHHEEPAKPLTGVDMPFMGDEEHFITVTMGFLTASMFFLFAMFAPVQNVVTTTFPGYGTVSLVLLYGTFMMSATVAPMVVRALGAPNAVMFSAVGYVLYTMSCMLDNVGVFIFMSIIIGLCAGVIWTAQGVVLTTLSTATNRGRNAALILGGVRLSAIICNLILGYILNSFVTVPLEVLDDGTVIPEHQEPRYSTTLLFFVFFLVGCIGVANFLVLRVRMVRVHKILARKEEAARVANEAAKEALAKRIKEAALAAGLAHVDEIPSVPLLVVTRVSLKTRLLEIFKLFREPNYKFFVPVLFLQGLSVGFFFGSYGVIYGKNFLGFAQAAMGCCSVSVILGLGRWLDRVPRSMTFRKKQVLYVTFTMHIIHALLAFVVAYHSDGYTSREPAASKPRVVDIGIFRVLVYLSCMCYGCGWSGTDVTLYYFIGQSQQHQSEAAFAGKAFIESLAFVVAQGIIALLPTAVYPLLAASWVLPIMYVYSKWEFPVEKMHSKLSAAELDAALANDIDSNPSLSVTWHA